MQSSSETMAAGIATKKDKHMTTEKLSMEALFKLFDETSSKLLLLVSSFNEEELLASPFINSWSPAQITEHIIKSNMSILHLLTAKGKITEREPDLRAMEVKELFLDFTRKFQSPQAVLPTRSIYRKDIIIEDLKKSIEQVRELHNNINVYETADIPGFGVLTKLELIHFILYHTQRHVKQLENMRNQKQVKV
jgi:hypothetical protein